MDPVYPRWRYPLIFYGQTAAEHLVRRLMHSPIFINPPLTHDWLIAPLGLNNYPIEQREYRGRVIPYQPDASGLQATAVRKATSESPAPALTADVAVAILVHRSAVTACRVTL